jgi:hypothetical protein
MSIKDVIGFLLIDRKNYRNLTNKEKEDNFFIINRFLSKKFPIFANKLNLKGIDKSLALDMWYLEIGDQLKKKTPEFKNFFGWFWSKGGKIKPNNLSDKDNKYLIERLRLDQEDLNFLLTYFEEDVKEEMKYFKKLDKQ